MAVYEIDAGGIPLFLAITPAALVLSTDKTQVGTMIDGLASGGGGATAPAAIRERGNQGFVVLDPGRAAAALSSLGATPPPGMDFASGADLTLEQRSGWRRAMITVPNGEAMIAAILKGAL